MKYGICPLSVVPMRAVPSHESELVSELLYNDVYKIIDENDEWLKIQCEYDSYEGWIRRLQHDEISEIQYNKLLSGSKYVINTPISIYNNLILSCGSYLFEKTEHSINIPDIFDVNIMIETAKKFLGVPYRWGGKSIMGIDCSALVQICCKTAGYKLKRDASQQINNGKTITSIDEAEPGDLAYFHNENNKITHVGILISKDKIIHASGVVRIDRIDDKGIFNDNDDNYTHQLSVIKRLT